MQRLRFAFLYIAYLFLAVVLVVVFAELFLSVCFVATGASAFGTLIGKDEHPYPGNPAEYLKIAIFGGSAAAGWGSERGFAHIIDYELKKKCPDRKVYVRNYAECSATFHSGQAEILKSVIDKYDVFLIYAGNNEHLPYLLDTADSAVLGGESQAWGVLLGFLEKYSRLYAVSIKISRLYIGPLFTKAAFLRGVRDKDSAPTGPGLFENTTRVPWSERTKVVANFQSDLDEIADLVRSKQKYLVISSVPVNENYKPLFSVVSPTLDDNERDLLYRRYYDGMERFEQGDFPGAMESFAQARLIDQNVSIINYMIGQALLRLGNLKEGRRYLGISSDHDGFMARALTAYWTGAKLIPNKYSNVYYVDSVESFHSALDEGVEYAELFADIHHPSLMGHIIIANGFICEIARAPQLRKCLEEQVRRNLTPSELRSLVKRYREALGVTQDDDSMVALQRSRGHLATSLSFPDSADYLPEAETNIFRFFEKSRRTPETRAKMCILLAMIEIGRENFTKALNYANEALALSRLTVWSILIEPLPNGHLAYNVFKRAGISYSESEDRFIAPQWSGSQGSKRKEM
jgi:tetratricopeptide (TPR) repeat protein